MGKRERDEARVLKRIRPFEETRRSELIKALRISGGRPELAAMGLRIGRATVYRWMKRYDLDEFGNER